MKVIFINTVFVDHVSSENIGLHILLGACIIVVANDDGAPSRSSQIAEQNEMIKKVLFFYQGVLKLNDSAKNKEKGDKTQFSPNKHYRKGK